MNKQTKAFDVIIIGAGVTGLATGMYAARLGMKNLILGTTSASELPIGGVITLTEVVENYPGFIRLTGPELAQKLEDHARSYPEVTIKEEKATDISKIEKGNCFVVKTEESEYKAKAVIYATGAKWKLLPMKGAQEFANKGVHYCALCDGALYKDRIISVIGGSDTAAKEALLLSEHAKKVYIIYRGDKLRPEPINAKRVENNKKIEVILNTNVLEIKGEKLVNSIVLDREHKGKKELEMDAVFGAIGSIPLSELAQKIGVKVNKKGEIMIDRESKTNIPGFFAAGDVVDTSFKQAITGVAEGVTAAHSAYEHISNSEVCITDDEIYDNGKK